MTDSDDNSKTLAFSENAMTAFLQIGTVVVLMYLCVQIVGPFIGLIAWGLIIAIAVYPLHLRLATALGGSEKRAAIAIVLVGFILIVAPTYFLLDSAIDSAQTVAHDFRSGSFVIPPPDPSVQEWPVIGKRTHDLWSKASQNLEATLQTYEVQLTSIGESMLRNLGSGLLGALVFVGSMLVAGVFLVSGKSGYRVSCAAASSIAGDRGPTTIDLTIATIRSVAKGVLGVAFVQTAFAVVGLVVMDVPAAGLWGAIILVVAIMQLPPWLILAPIAVWVFSVNDPLPATVFAVYALVVSVSDMFLKPLFLGRGVDVPMPVILIGAIGGAIWAGVIGLFVGAVVLAVGYEFFLTWIYSSSRDVPAAPEANEADVNR